MWTFSSSFDNGDDIDLCNVSRIEGCSLLVTCRIGDVAFLFQFLDVLVCCSLCPSFGIHGCEELKLTKVHCNCIVSI